MTHEKLQRIAIIGCGYVGQAVGRKLVAAGYDVLATTTTHSQMAELQQMGMTPCLLELADVDQLCSVLTNRDSVVLTFGAGRHGDYDQVYTKGAQNIVQAMADTQVRRVIYTSSTRVYHQCDGSWVDESSPTKPHDAKGQALVEAERTLLTGVEMSKVEGLKSKNIERNYTASILRLGGIHGPQRELIDRIKNCAGQTRDDGQAYINLIHLDDIVAVIEKLLHENYHGVLNLTNDKPMTRRQLYDTLLLRSKMKPIQWTDNQHMVKGKRVCNWQIKQLLQISLSRQIT